MQTILEWGSLFVVFFIIIAIHEVGHAWAAIKSRVIPVNFFVGFPKLFSFKTKWVPVKIGLFPFLGGVEMPASYEEKGWKTKIFVSSAGPAASILVGALLLFGLPILFGQDGYRSVITTGRSLVGCEAPSLMWVAIFSHRMLTQGIIPFLAFIGFLSIFIGVLNLLPLPPLDGGHIVIAVLERIFKRKFETVVTIVSLAVIIYLLIDFFSGAVQVATSTAVC